MRIQCIWSWAGNTVYLVYLESQTQKHTTTYYLLTYFYLQHGYVGSRYTQTDHLTNLLIVMHTTARRAGRKPRRAA